MSDPKVLKNIILKMTPDEITKTFIEDNFGSYYDEATEMIIPPRYQLTDKIILLPHESINETRIVTTLGRLITNKMLFEAGFKGVIDYVNEPMTGKKLEWIEDVISNAILDKKVTTDIVADYYNRVQWLGLALHSFVCGSFTEKTLNAQIIIKSFNILIQYQ